MPAVDLFRTVLTKEAYCKFDHPGRTMYIQGLFYFKMMTMFGLFKKKSEKEKLDDIYEKLMQESYKLSHTDRAASDLKRADAEEVLNKIKTLENEGQS